MVGPQSLDLGFELLFARPEAVDFRVQVLDFSRLTLHLVTFLLKLSLERLFLFAEARLKRGNLVFEILHLPRVHLFALIMLDLLCLHLDQLFLQLFILPDRDFKCFALHQELLEQLLRLRLNLRLVLGDLVVARLDLLVVLPKLNSNMRLFSLLLFYHLAHAKHR